MRRLTRREDPTGFLNLFRMASADRFGDPSGHIQAHGQYEHRAKKGPGRRHEGPRVGRCQHGSKWLSGRTMRRGR